MKHHLWLTCALVINPAKTHAQEYISDAFGLVNAAEATVSDRSDWAGFRERMWEGKTFPSRIVSPGKIEKVLAFVGHKSAVAGKDKVHAVAIALDRVGNAVSDNTNAEFQIGTMDKITAVTQFGLADVKFLPPPKAGMYHVGIAVSDKQSARAEFRVVPDLDGLVLSLAQNTQPFQSESYANISTSKLRDQFGNGSGDGVAVQFVFAHADNTNSLLTVPTVASAARAQFLTRGLGSDAQLKIGLGQKQSAPVSFSVAPLITQAAPEVHAAALPDIGATRLRIGPFMTDAGHLLNDGVPVTINLTSEVTGRQSYDGWLRDGLFEVLIPIGQDQLPATIMIQTISGTFSQTFDYVSDTATTIEWGLE